MRRAQIDGHIKSDNSLLMPELESTCRPIFVQLQSELPLGRALIMGVTSPSRGDGRSTFTLGLAAAGAYQINTQGRLLLVDADVENPTLHLRCGADAGPGLYEVITGQIQITKAIVEVMPGVWLLPAGARPVNAARHLKKLEEFQLFEKLGKHFDAVLVDLPPVQTPGLGVLPSQLVPQVLMIARAGVTKRDDLQNAMSAFPPDHLSAVILNEYRERIPRWVRRFLN
jgi:polysaccharide biosynthesis transport protein